MHINLGAGDVEISSPKGLRLNDLQWHEVLISRKDADVMLQVDHIHTTRYFIEHYDFLTQQMH